MIRLFGLLLVLLVRLAYCQEKFKNPDVPLSNEIQQFIFVHLVANVTTNSSLEPGDVVGAVEKYPEKLSEKFDGEVRLSMNYYDQKDFQKARSVLEKAIREESTPFIMKAYARACYQIDKATSFIIYKKLIANLDSITRSTPKKIAVDVWFREAYWKLGTLYMDSRDWKRANFEISRFMMSIGDAKGQYIWEQALQYLTECAYNDYDDKLAFYLAKRVLIYNPENKYAKKVLEKIK